MFFFRTLKDAGQCEKKGEVGGVSGGKGGEAHYVRRGGRNSYQGRTKNPSISGRQKDQPYVFSGNTGLGLPVWPWYQEEAEALLPRKGEAVGVPPGFLFCFQMRVDATISTGGSGAQKSWEVEGAWRMRTWTGHGRL